MSAQVARVGLTIDVDDVQVRIVEGAKIPDGLPKHVLAQLVEEDLIYDPSAPLPGPPAGPTDENGADPTISTPDEPSAATEASTADLVADLAKTVAKPKAGSKK